MRSHTHIERDPGNIPRWERWELVKCKCGVGYKAFTPAKPYELATLEEYGLHVAGNLPGSEPR